MLSYALLSCTVFCFVVLLCVGLYLIILRFCAFFNLHIRSSAEDISGRMLTPSTPLFTARWRRLLPSMSTSYRKSSTVPRLSAAIKQSGFRVKSLIDTLINCLTLSAHLVLIGIPLTSLHLSPWRELAVSCGHRLDF